jgi:hypothetical protein
MERMGSPKGADGPIQETAARVGEERMEWIGVDVL